MRKLSEPFLEALKSGFLQPLTEAVRNDNDLDLHIRQNYFNIYYKGHSLLKLTEPKNKPYKAEIHRKFTDGIELLDFNDDVGIRHFVQKIPDLKANIAKVTSSLEIEYEQLIIRANNQERRNNSDYYIIDRQYSVNRFRFDLLGVRWERKKNVAAKPCLIEIKYALNPDIANLPRQMATYYKRVQEKAASISEETECIFKQKLQLGLFPFPENRLQAMEQVKIARAIEDFCFIIILVDYNPRSKLLNLNLLHDLPFANQIKIFHTGFAMWEQNLQSLKSSAVV